MIIDNTAIHFFCHQIVWGSFQNENTKPSCSKLHCIYSTYTHRDHPLFMADSRGALGTTQAPILTMCPLFLPSCPGDAALPPVPGARLPPAGPGRGSRAPAHPPGRQRLQPQVLRAAPIREYPVAMLPPWADMISATRRGFYFGIIEIPERHISADETSL